MEMGLLYAGPFFHRVRLMHTGVGTGRKPAGTRPGDLKLLGRPKAGLGERRGTAGKLTGRLKNKGGPSHLTRGYHHTRTRMDVCINTHEKMHYTQILAASQRSSALKQGETGGRREKRGKEKEKKLGSRSNYRLREKKDKVRAKKQ